MAIRTSDQISIVDLTDGYSVILTNDSYTFAGSTSTATAGSTSTATAGSTSTATAGSTTTTVVAMCGATQVAASVNLDDVVKPAGVTVTKDTDATQPTLTIAVANTVTTGGVVDIPVQIDNGTITIHKLFTFQIAFKGSPGAAGTSAQWYTGTAITGTSTTPTTFPDSGITAAKAGDMYLNTSTQNTYRCTTAGAASAAKWAYVSNIKGQTGETGDGAIWYTGTGITGTSTTPTIFSDSGVSNAKVGDMYLNTSTQNTYRCTVAGAASVAKWIYVSNIKTLQELCRRLRKAGAKSDATRGCGVHIHIGANGHTPQTLRNLANIMASHEELLVDALKLERNSNRYGHYCKPVNHNFLDLLNRRKPTTMTQLADIWYKGNGANYGRDQHYNDSRYHMLNLHATFTKGTIEFRLFQFDAPADGKRNGIHAGQLKSYIQLCLALSEMAKEVKTASPKPQQTENPKFAMRTWLMRLGFIGEEFATARDFLTRNLTGDAAFRNGRAA